MAKGDRAVEHGQDLILFAHDLAEPDSARRDHGLGGVLTKTRRPLFPKKRTFRAAVQMSTEGHFADVTALQGLAGRTVEASSDHGFLHERREPFR